MFTAIMLTTCLVYVVDDGKALIYELVKRSYRLDKELYNWKLLDFHGKHFRYSVHFKLYSTLCIFSADQMTSANMLEELAILIRICYLSYCTDISFVYNFRRRQCNGKHCISPGS